MVINYYSKNCHQQIYSKKKFISNPESYTRQTDQEIRLKKVVNSAIITQYDKYVVYIPKKKLLFNFIPVMFFFGKMRYYHCLFYNLFISYKYVLEPLDKCLTRQMADQKKTT